MTSLDNYRPLSRRARAFTGIAAVVPSCASLSAVFAIFDSAGSTPWFSADEAGIAAHCEPVREATKRHACLHGVALQASTTRLAAR